MLIASSQGLVEFERVKPFEIDRAVVHLPDRGRDRRFCSLMRHGCFRSIMPRHTDTHVSVAWRRLETAQRAALAAAFLVFL